ncbi:2-polyprenyl-3-methyl-6-methoxy-1,4-benzoquinone monooxygenase [Aquicella lusitana]|uniref:3-demethoxyubiquinol 3-hydroxylase n=1 Tax=Aquicella lusitana TaxID=254246 RepID=A0A370GC95_9COXI|nr:2-polyprenyl-3-methyl-6-methoxy-1,4-benzoquinone monooxygenase [Aquicella lusitana]RDI41327.1 ubiquinone biosynthesis monooxygenase Coq7 [Aquicella lusitana]VVC72307.1 2-nonaprenyl-3-methyl-6-methoxy-1,4-benzoquinol hydroxylase [Aquicella lusitana]
MTSQRHYSFLDKLCLGVDQAIRALTNHPRTSGKPYPASDVDEYPLSDVQRRQSAALMRINHAGEICAQALYHGQGIISHSDAVQTKMQQAAIEEGDHLDWCGQRLEELGSHTSYLNPLWYAGSFCIGMIAGMIGDKWSLGFVAETERQVIRHLEGHLHLLPVQDQRSYTILEQMERDEAKHRDEAVAAGAEELPDFIKRMMALTSKVMVKTAYWV